MSDNQIDYNLPPTEPESSRKWFRLRYFITIVLICAIVPVAAAGWTDLYKRVLEHNKPVIEIIEAPRGVGISPVSVKFRVTDFDSGLDEAVIRVRQKGPVRELKRYELKGKISDELQVDFDGENSGLDEGVASIEVRAFDKSFWSNAAELSLDLRVDYRKPKVEVLSGQHNARQGGSQLVFYKAYDEDLAISGVKVGNKTFLGFPATGIDKDLNEKSLFLAIYAIPLDQDVANLPVRLFAEDTVGNAASTSFYNKIFSRQSKSVNVNLTEEFLREKVVPLATDGRSRLKISSSQGDLNKLPHGSLERLLEDFKFVNEKLRLFNENELYSLLTKSPRHESYWSGPFFRQPAVVQYSFADTLNFVSDGKSVGKATNYGEDLLFSRDQKEVQATSEGIVVFSQDLGIYGWSVGVDHGLGVVSIYSRLSNAAVKKGDAVTKGQVLGTVGNSGLGRNNGLYFEMRVQGVPVDPKEWWENGWYYSHIVGKINDLKKTLGIPVYAPLKFK